MHETWIALSRFTIESSPYIMTTKHWQFSILNAVYELLPLFLSGIFLSYSCPSQPSSSMQRIRLYLLLSYLQKDIFVCLDGVEMFVGCCYTTVDSAMAASQNGFCSYKLSIHKKTNIMQTMTKNITIFIYNLRVVVKLDHFVTLSLSYTNTVQ